MCPPSNMHHSSYERCNYRSRALWWTLADQVGYNRHDLSRTNNNSSCALTFSRSLEANCPLQSKTLECPRTESYECCRASNSRVVLAGGRVVLAGGRVVPAGGRGGLAVQIEGDQVHSRSLVFRRL